MVIALGSQLKAALNEAAKKQGVAPELFAVNILSERLLPRKRRLEPQDDWERELLAIASDCGGNLTDEDLSSEGIYD